MSSDEDDDPDVADAEAAVAEAEAAVVEAELAVVDDQLAALEPESEGAPPRLVAWAKREPLFATLVAVLVLAAPFGLVAIQGYMAAERLRSGLDAWEEALELAGIPVPALGRRLVPTPPWLVGVELAAYTDAGLGERFRVARAWRALLADEPIGADAMPERAGAGAAMWVCTGLRDPRANPDELRSLSARTPEQFRAALLVACDVKAGRHLQALRRAADLRAQASRGGVAALAALEGQAIRSRVRQILDLRPPTNLALRELLDYATHTETLHTALEASEVPALLTAGTADVERGATLLEVLGKGYPAGLAGSTLEGMWPQVQEALLPLVRERLAAWELDPAPALAIIAEAARLDPTCNLVTEESFALWRLRLKEVVDDPVRLGAFVRRFLELGWLPAGVEELVASHYVGRGVVEGGSSPGAILTRALASVLGGQSFDTASTELDRALAERTDPVAKRIRAQQARLSGLSLASGSPSLAVPFYRAALEAGYEPRFRLLEELARCLAGADALKLARERVALLERHVAEANPQDLVRLIGWELRGYPVHPQLLNPVRAAAHLALAELLLASGETEEAGKACGRARELDSTNARSLLISARIHQAAGRTAAARKAVFKGLQGVREETLRKQFRDMLRQLGPN